MNCPSRTDEPLEGDGHNQNPNALSNDLTTNEDLNGIANARELRGGDPLPIESAGETAEPERSPSSRDANGDGDDRVMANAAPVIGQSPGKGQSQSVNHRQRLSRPSASPSPPPPPPSLGSQAQTQTQSASSGSGNGAALTASDKMRKSLHRAKHVIVTFGKFVGPGFMIAVAYIDPGNYSTDIAAGASYRFRLLFVVLLSNLFAIFLQSLSIKLGTVSGLNLAEACRAFLPRWLNYVLYAMAEIAIIATDIAEVIGTAIALNLLVPQLPLVAGCAISIVDVMIILIFYRPNNASLRGLRAFEAFVICLVLAVVVCFCVQLSLIRDDGTSSVGDVFRGYLPSSALVESKGLYQACGILGATVMPHSLYLGSGIVQPRLREYDAHRGLLPPEPAPRPSTSSDHGAHHFGSSADDKAPYIPSVPAIRSCMKYSILELAISLFTFALFVNSSILIVAGASLYNNAEAQDADIFGIHDLLSDSLGSAAGTVFALALLLSGVSAGIVCTIAGQMVSEGALRWAMKPWLRRLFTRSISITPSIIIAGAVGRQGLDAALNGSQVALSVVLPFVSAPLIYFTCMNKYMTVRNGGARYLSGRDEEDEDLDAIPMGGLSHHEDAVKMRNPIWISLVAVLVWLIIASMNVANLVLLGKGDS